MRAALGYGKEDHFVKRGFKLRGVVHIGMNDGEEVTWYWHVGRLPVLGFEPQPDVYKEACENYASEIASGKVEFVNLALSETPGIMEMRVPITLGVRDTKVASGLLDIEIKENKLVEIVKVECVRFDVWVDREQRDLTPYNVLVVDVQGMELDVLRSFGPKLDFFDFLMIELSEKPLWVNEAPAYEVEEYLKTKGFTRDSPIVSHNDVMFIRTILL